MSAKVLRAKSASNEIVKDLRTRATVVTEQRGHPPHLAVLGVGGDPSSQIYLRKKLQACKDVGIECTLESLPDTITEIETLRILKRLGEDATLDGIILELPLPKQLSARTLTDAITTEKDVEGITRKNLGRLYAEKRFDAIEHSDALIPCTAHSIIRLLLETKQTITGKRAVVIGRSNIVGKPTAYLLSSLDATVTLCHSKTVDLEREVRDTDIVVSGAGVPDLIKGAWIKKGAIVLDAGTTVVGRRVVGDVEYDAAAERAGWITPVPGGVGPLTVTFLLYNTILSAERRTKKAFEN
ncbi:MAG: bifunctional 5,10-methylene-tetrahydrofolate dehydrogenase/5,10-methylene-tetrahydrofolate cyclohydrolase [Elusimicrobia bacterium]|nr:MAG: bifunctional 5,10-methylene-tetrahydrofolate dehydrogenase/5,10-methylene-tetrahydrofolate cyclohydrolase [Elusimicrobiota bacterium]